MLNKLEFKTKKQVLLSIAILHSSKFRSSREETEDGRRLYNRELKEARKNIKKYNIHLSKPLPDEL